GRVAALPVPRQLLHEAWRSLAVHLRRRTVSALEDEVRGRAGWTLVAGTATYGPSASGWSAPRGETRGRRRAARRWHAAAVDPTGVARSALTAYSPDEAIRWSEAVINKTEG